MMHHIANLLADKHAKEKSEWLMTHSDECYNYTHSNGDLNELKVTNECVENRKNVFYLNSYLSN